MSWGTDWGSTPWGGSGAIGGSPLALVFAEAWRENVIRLTFSRPIYYSHWHDPDDGSFVDRYTVTANPATVGIDGKPARSVAVADIQPVIGSTAQVDVWLDRRMSPAGAKYLVQVTGLVTSDRLYGIDTARATWVVDGLAQGLPAQDVLSVVGNRDIANPQTGSANVGRYQYDDTGDYGIDRGLVAYKKRVFRRLITRKGAYRHLPDYGVGFPQAVKLLARSTVVTNLAVEAMAQIRQEPETLDVTVTVDQANAAAGLWVYRIHAKTTLGDLSDYMVPVPT